jgi:hypothetical protein
MRKLVTVLLVALAIPASASAATPTAATGPAKNPTQSSVVLNGTVNPKGEATTYYFQYGTTTAYGSQTPTQGPTAAVSTNQPASANVDGLAPNTTYHFRLVAVNASGTANGKDAKFTTTAAPASITLGAAPAAVVYGKSVALSGTYAPQAGKPAAGVKITLNQAAAPYQPKDYKAATTATTDAAGHFSFTQTPVHNTSYQVSTGGKGGAVSSAVLVTVAPVVTLRLSTAHPRPGRKVVFSGLVSPAHNGALVRIQKRVSGRWRTVKSAALTASPTAPTQSVFRVALRVRKKGTYRAFVAGDSQNAAGASRRRVVAPRRR